MIHAMKKKYRVPRGEDGETTANLVVQVFPEEKTFGKRNEQELPRSKGEGNTFKTVGRA